MNRWKYFINGQGDGNVASLTAITVSYYPDFWITVTDSFTSNLTVLIAINCFKIQFKLFKYICNKNS